MLQDGSEILTRICQWFFGAAVTMTVLFIAPYCFSVEIQRQVRDQKHFQHYVRKYLEALKEGTKAVQAKLDAPHIQADELRREVRSLCGVDRSFLEKAPAYNSISITDAIKDLVKAAQEACYSCSGPIEGNSDWIKIDKALAEFQQVVAAGTLIGNPPVFARFRQSFLPL